MTMKRKRSNKREAIDWIELSSDATRLDSERQYLYNNNNNKNNSTTK